jgi:hypothetical protein
MRSDDTAMFNQPYDTPTNLINTPTNTKKHPYSARGAFDGRV